MDIVIPISHSDSEVCSIIIRIPYNRSSCALKIGSHLFGNYKQYITPERMPVVSNIHGYRCRIADIVFIVVIS